MAATAKQCHMTSFCWSSNGPPLTVTLGWIDVMILSLSSSQCMAYGLIKIHAVLIAVHQIPAAISTDRYFHFPCWGWLLKLKHEKLLSTTLKSHSFFFVRYEASKISHFSVPFLFLFFSPFPSDCVTKPFTHSNYQVRAVSFFLCFLFLCVWFVWVGEKLFDPVCMGLFGCFKLNHTRSEKHIHAGSNSRKQNNPLLFGSRESMRK